MKTRMKKRKKRKNRMLIKQLNNNFVVYESLYRLCSIHNFLCDLRLPEKAP